MSAGGPGGDAATPEPAVLRSYLLRRRLADRLDEERRRFGERAGRVSESRWIEAILEAGLERLDEVLRRLTLPPPAAEAVAGAAATAPVRPGVPAPVAAGGPEASAAGDELLGVAEPSPEGAGPLADAYEAAWRVGAAIARPAALAGRQRRLAALLRGHGGRATIAFVSGTPGTGQTTCCACVGMAFAASQAGRTVCVDGGEVDALGARVGRRAAGIEDALRDASRIAGWADMRAYTTVVDPGVEVLAGPLEPGRLGGAEHGAVHDLLLRHYSWLLYDLGDERSLPELVGLADQVVVVAQATVEATQGADRALSRLHEWAPPLAESATLVFNGVGGPRQVEVRLLARYFQRHVRDVVAIPHDRRLAGSRLVDWAALQPATRDAYLELAGVIAEGLGPAPRGGDS